MLFINDLFKDKSNIFSFFIATFLSIAIAFYIYRESKIDAERQELTMQAIQDSTRNHIEGFSEIFARQFKMLLDIKANGEVRKFKYVNFFLNFGEIYTMFPKLEDEFKNAAINIGLTNEKYNKIKKNIENIDYTETIEDFKILNPDKIPFDDLDFTNLKHCVKLFQVLLMEIVFNKTSEFHLVLVADENLDIDKTTQYANRSYEITALTINILIEQKNKNKQIDKTIDRVISKINNIKTEADKIEKDINRINNRIEYNNTDFDEELLYEIAILVADKLDNINFNNELGNEKDKIKNMQKLDSISHLFGFPDRIDEDKRVHVERLNKLLCDQCPNTKGDYRKDQIIRLKGKVFSSLEGIYYLLMNLKLHTTRNYIMVLSSYILYSQRINKFLIAEYRRRKLLIEHIRNDRILVTKKRQISFIAKSHFPYQGTLGYIFDGAESKPAALIFFIGGDTVGRDVEGYYSEQKKMFNLHKNSFDNTVISNVQDKFHFIKINLKQQATEDILNDIKMMSENKETLSSKKEFNEDELLLNVVKAALNFRFWDDNDTYWGENGKGTDTLFNILDTMVKEEKVYLDYFEKLDQNDFKEAITYDGKMVPDWEKRYNFIKTIVAKIKEEKDETLSSLLKIEEKDAIKIIYALIETFGEIFEDSISYKGKDILVAKKAIYFIKSLIQYEGYRELTNLNDMNILADYKIPQYLRHEEILEYRHGLGNKVNSKVELVKDSLMENEIRLATIQFGKVLQQYSISNAAFKEISILDIDEYIWRKSQELKRDKKSGEKKVEAFHRVKTTKY